MSMSPHFLIDFATVLMPFHKRGAKGEVPPPPAATIFSPWDKAHLLAGGIPSFHWRVEVISVRSVFKSVFSLCVIGEIKADCCF